MKASFSHNIDDELCRAFDATVDIVGGEKYRHVEAAIKAYLALPESLQDQLRKPRTSIETAKLKIRTHYIEAEVQLEREKLSPHQEQLLLAAIRQIEADGPQKKKAPKGQK